MFGLKRRVDELEHLLHKLMCQHGQHEWYHTHLADGKIKLICRHCVASKTLYDHEKSEPKSCQQQQSPSSSMPSDSSSSS